MKYFAALTDGHYGEKEADAIYSINTINCAGASTNQGPNSLAECTRTRGDCTALNSPPAAIECTLPFSESMSCFNGGSPTATESGSGDTSDTLQLYIYCQCPQEFTGEMCEIKHTPTCHNGGTPKHQSGDIYSCACTDRFTGTYCESDLLPICQNGGTADFSSGSWVCLCSVQFTGPYCETDLKPICHNGGTAVLSGVNWSCDCMNQFTGDFCETDLLPVCQNGGTADFSLGSWACLCLVQFTGPYCESDLRPVCHNGGTAVLSGVSWLCDCTIQFTGDFCETDLKPVCHNGGTAEISGSSWSCRCSDDYTGMYCESDLRPLCLNGGSAEYASGKWKCTCLQDFSGNYCETELSTNGLVSDGNGTLVLLQCLNKGTVDSASKSCKCIGGFTGDYCETAPKKDKDSEISMKNGLFLWTLVLSVLFLIIGAIVIYVCVKLKNQRKLRIAPESSRYNNMTSNYLREGSTDAHISMASENRRRTAEEKPFKYTEVVSTNKTHDLRLDVRKKRKLMETDMILENIDD